MKVFIKIGLVVLGLAGVMYWLGGKSVYLARHLQERCFHNKKEEENT